MGWILSSTGEKSGLIILTLVLIPSLVFSLGIRVTWNRNTESDLAGYWVYWGTSPNSYDHLIGVDTISSVDVMGLEAGKTYYFAVTARDTSGNQSGFSQQASITIPADAGNASRSGSDINSTTGTPGNNSGSKVNPLSSIIVQTEDAIRQMLGLGPNDPIYSLNDSTGSAVVQGSAASSSATTANAGWSPEESDALDRYPVMDAVLLVSTPFDLTTIYPGGIYFLTPLDEDCPDITGDMLTVDTPGCYLYLVFDKKGNVVHVLRLSVAEEIFQLQNYDPHFSLLLEDEVSGVALDVPMSATSEIKPLAIGWGGDAMHAGAAQFAQGGEAVLFDILPYGLDLEEPALVSVPFKGDRCAVQRYDEKSGVWVDVEDAKVSGGYVSFSTQTLGRFKVADPSQEQEGNRTTAAVDSDGSNCFIDVCQDPCTSVWATLLLAVLASFIALVLAARQVHPK